MAVDYLTKWVEALPVREVTADTLADFIETNVYYDVDRPAW